MEEEIDNRTFKQWVQDVNNDRPPAVAFAVDALTDEDIDKLIARIRDAVRNRGARLQ